MSAPLIWIFIPILAGLLFWVLRKRFDLVILLSTILCLLLAGLAWLLPIDATVRIASLTFYIDPALDFAGRRLVLENGDRFFLTFIYFLCAFWFAGSHSAGANNLLIPFGLGIVASLVGALAVEPFLYAALLVEMAVLLAVPVLAPPGKRFGQGVLRFLIFQTLAMPFILLAGWALAGVEANPSNTTLVLLATVFLALGLAFWLAVFPFYTWIPLLAEQAYPYVTGFIFLVFPTVNLMLGLSFLDRFGWLRTLPGIFAVISQVGALMVGTAGIWAAFQKDLSRLFGYAVIVETGFSLLAVGLGNHSGLVLFTSMFLPRLLGLGLWALSLSVMLQVTPSTRFEDVRSLLQKAPFASAGLAVASLSLAGLPLLAAFPIHQVLLQEMARQSFLTALWSLIGSVGLLLGTFRALAVMARGGSGALPQSHCESRMQITLLLSGIVGLVIIGFLPQLFLPMMDGLLNAFTQLP